MTGHEWAGLFWSAPQPTHVYGRCSCRWRTRSHRPQDEPIRLIVGEWRHHQASKAIPSPRGR